MKHWAKILILLMVLINDFVCAQNFNDDMKKMGEQYQRNASLSTDLVVEVQYDKESPLQVHQKARLRKKENGFYYLIGKSETIVTDHLLIMVNETNKSIFFRELKQKEQELIAKSYYRSGIDSVVSKYDSVAYLGVGKQGKHYVVYASKNMITKTDLFIDVNTGMINRVEYGYNEKLSKDIHKVVISFTYPDSTTFDEKLLKEETYLVKAGAKYKTAQKYSNYELNKVDNE